MGEEWLEVRIDEGAIRNPQELRRRYRIHLCGECGECGEYETLVLDAPYFKERIELTKTERVWYGDRGVLKVLDARGVEK
jgi:diphthamide synthase (EF-2-diphthine--ammonia ligase)